ncbi:MAG: phosphatase PAP2 family protein [Nitrososphaerales archaeon]
MATGTRDVQFLKRKRLLVAGIATLLLFILVAVLVVLMVTQAYDSSVALAMNKNLGPQFTAVMSAASNYGREYFWSGIVALMFIFGNRNTKIYALELGVLLVGGIIVGESLKMLIYRERPYGEALSGIILRAPADTDSSFPSGHALIVSIGAIFVLTRFKKNGKIIPILLAIEAAIVCYSRIYLGLHYPMDVLGGVLVGATIVFIGLAIIENYFAKVFDSVGTWFQKRFRSIRVPEVF